MADVQIAVALRESSPFGYEVPNTQEIIPKCVSALIDGSGAASSFIPTVEIISDGGIVVATCPAPTVAAGGSALVSWFPGGGVLGGGGGVQRLVGARIEAHTQQSIPNNSNTNLTYDTVAFDTAGMANLGSDARKLTVTQPGLYLVVCESVWTYNSAGRRLNVITQNGLYSGGGTSVIAGDSNSAIWSPVGGAGGGAPFTPNISATLTSAVAGDFFASGAFQASGGSLGVNGLAAGSNQDNFLSAVLIGSL